MSSQWRTQGTIAAILAFVFCLAAGIWILMHADLSGTGDVLEVGIGLYFIGKAFFVGPMLLLTALRSSD